ncbi:MAG: Gfo/Idh/MocA family oxidoreductase [Kiritimatiellae bacterium]|nr:Gfo/Idh/MocA family oxidoreductase [Kiritimatiellia bacterium]
MSKTNCISRRSFLRTGAVLTASSAFPFLRVAGQVSPNEKVNVACCGIGNRGADVVNGLFGTGLCNIIAVCDTDLGAKHTQNILKKFPNAKRYKDFRKMLDEMGNQIDAVTAGVPDHAHFPIAMMAMGMGKGIYVEKPMAHTFQECALMMAAEAKNKVATQMGNQGHSEGNYFQFKTLVEQGVIKDVTKIVAHMNGVRRWHKWNGNVTSLRPKQDLPEGLEWDVWLSQAQWHDYHRDYVHGDWRCWYDFGNGALGDWGAHIIDTAHEFLQLGLPYEVDVLKMTGHTDFVFPMTCTLAFRFSARGNMPACEVQWWEGQKNFPELPKNFGKSKAAADIPTVGGGATAVADLNPGKEIYQKDGTIFKGASHGSTLSVVGGGRELPKFPKSPSNHFKNFLLGVKGQETCRSRFAVAGTLSQVLTLGCIAQKLNRKITLDTAKGVITGDKVADAMLKGPPPRKGWEQYYKV